MINFYIVMNKTTAWGVGKTKEQAAQDATRRVTEQYGTHEAFLDEMERLMGRRYETELYVTSRREVALNGVGFYLEPITIMEWDDKLVDTNLYALARLAGEQQEHNCIASVLIAPINTVIDTKYFTTVEDVAYCVNHCHTTEFSRELLAASYALNATKEAGRGFSKEEIEYHLKALVAAQAKFAYAIALGRAMAIASLYYNE